jgi:hypothetical protein
MERSCFCGYGAAWSSPKHALSYAALVLVIRSWVVSWSIFAQSNWNSEIKELAIGVLLFHVILHSLMNEWLDFWIKPNMQSSGSIFAQSNWNSEIKKLAIGVLLFHVILHSLMNEWLDFWIKPNMQM